MIRVPLQNPGYKSVNYTTTTSWTSTSTRSRRRPLNHVSNDRMCSPVGPNPWSSTATTQGPVDDEGYVDDRGYNTTTTADDYDDDDYVAGPPRRALAGKLRRDINPKKI